MWRIKQLSLQQKMFWPAFSAGLVGHLLCILVLTFCLDIAWFAFRNKGESIEINLYRSFRAAKKKLVTRGARKVVEQENIRDAPREVIEEEFAKKMDVEESTHEGTVFEAYLGSVYARIERRKYYPEMEQKKYHEGVVRVGFVISKDGRLKDVWLIKGCKHSALNQAALRTIKRAAPFSPIPDQFEKDGLPITMDIVYCIY
jgi:TonB family protein